MGNYFPKGDGPRTIDLKHKNIPTYFVLKQKSVLLAIDMSLTSLALMFLFFFELASTKINGELRECMNVFIRSIPNE